MSSSSNTMPLGGLEALVAAASAAKQASGSEKRTKKQRKGKDDQPAVQVSASSGIHAAGSYVGKLEDIS